MDPVLKKEVEALVLLMLARFSVEAGDHAIKRPGQVWAGEDLKISPADLSEAVRKMSKDFNEKKESKFDKAWKLWWDVDEAGLTGPQIKKRFIETLKEVGFEDE